MKTEYSRRSVVGVGALALVGTVLSGRADAQPTPGSEKAGAGDSKTGQGSATRTRTASCKQLLQRYQVEIEYPRVAAIR